MFQVSSLIEITFFIPSHVPAFLEIISIAGALILVQLQYENEILISNRIHCVSMYVYKQTQCTKFLFEYVYSNTNSTCVTISVQICVNQNARLFLFSTCTWYLSVLMCKNVSICIFNVFICQKTHLHVLVELDCSYIIYVHLNVHRN